MSEYQEIINVESFADKKFNDNVEVVWNGEKYSVRELNAIVAEIIVSAARHEPLFLLIANDIKPLFNIFFTAMETMDDETMNKVREKAARADKEAKQEGEE